MKKSRAISRRHLLAYSSATGAFIAWNSAGAANAEKLRRTPTQVLGPFYPLRKPLDTDADLTRISGKSGHAAGQVIYVMGRVLTPGGAPVAGARIEVWQANSHGRYTHPSDHNPAALDPNFEGYANLVSDSEGRYRFKTIKPAGYLAGDTMRAPHIHFDVSGRINRLVTQMYFPGEPDNERDIIMATATRNRNLLIATLRPPTKDLEADSQIANWDMVLEDG